MVDHHFEIEAIRKDLNQHFKDDVGSFTTISNTLDDISKKLDNHIESFKEHKIAQAKSNDDMKAEYGEVKLALRAASDKIEPVVEIFGNLKWGQKVLLKIGAVIGGLLGFSIGVVELIKLILNIKK